MHISFIVA
jgi:hypothetical protein